MRKSIVRELADDLRAQIMEERPALSDPASDGHVLVQFYGNNVLGLIKVTDISTFEDTSSILVLQSAFAAISSGCQEVCSLYIHFDSI